MTKSVVRSNRISSSTSQLTFCYSGVLIGLWEGVVFNHFVRRMPHSFDPYIGFGFRIFVDFLFTQSLSRLALVALWSLVGMLLADIAPNVWRDSGLRHLYRQVRKDVRHVKRSVPRIRIENDLPSVRLFKRSRSTPTEVSGSIRSDRATPSRSPAPSPALAPSPARRPGRSPPGTFPDVSGWSETATDISRLSLLRERVVTNPASPALISSREFAAGEHIDTTHTHVTTLETQTTTVHDTTVTTTQTQKEFVQSETVVEATTTVSSRALESAQDSSRHEPPTIPDDWVDIDHHTPIQANEPVPPFQADSELAPEYEPIPQTLSRPASVFDPPPVIDVLPDIPNVDADDKALQPPDRIPLPKSRAASVLGSVVDQPESRSASHAHSRAERTSHPPDRIPLPESRAASVIGTVVDQPEQRSASHAYSHTDKAASEVGGTLDQSQPRSALRESLRSGVDKAASEIGVDRAAYIATQSSKTQSTSRNWAELATWGRSRVKQATEVSAPAPPLKESREELVEQSKSDVGITGQVSEPPISTPAHVDPPVNILTQPGDAPPLLLTTEELRPGDQEGQPLTSKPELTPIFSAGVDTSPGQLQGEADKGDNTGPTRKDSLFNVPTPTRTPPPPFTEFAGVPEGPAAGEAPAEEDPSTHDEAETELTKEQKVAEEKRQAFLMMQASELEKSRADLQKKLANDDPSGSKAKALESDIEDAGKTLNSVKARMSKKKFSGESSLYHTGAGADWRLEPQSDSLIPQVSLEDKTATKAGIALTSAILDLLLTRDDAGPMTIQAVIRQKPKAKAKEVKDAVIAFAKR
ncbi:hypothetical protein JVU11DRAFT_2810 [Chiua virens]|nr:hypothetical protein JVU11DRAFT_2810 [Chiua virens]